MQGRLDNGYHQVRMIMQTVDLGDDLRFERTEGEIHIETECGEIPVGPDNLISRAITLMQKEYNIGGGLRVKLDKHIPIAAGMAGGSTDAAAALKAMNVLYGLGLSDEKLREQGVKLGADIPYCIMGGTVLSEGIGEILTPIEAMPDCTLVIAKPAVSVSTKEVYTRLDSHKIEVHPDVDGMIRAIGQGDLLQIASKLGNVLESVTAKMHPVISQIKQEMIATGAIGSLMSGSGPTVFGIYNRRADVENAVNALKTRFTDLNLFVTRPVSPVR